MKFRIITLTLFLAIAGAFYSCSEGSDADRAADEMVAETENALANIGAEIKEESNEFATEFRDAQAVISQRMEAIEADMKTASGETKAELQEEWNKLETWSNEIDDRMNRVGDNLEKGWKDFTGDVKDGWKSFSQESKRLLNEIERDLDPEGDLE